MRETAEIMLRIPNDIIIAQTTVVTACLALMVWLGLLGRPSRATLLWTLGFVLGLLGTYGSIAEAATGTDVLLHPVSMGLICGTPTLFWSGLRAYKGERPYAWAGFVVSGASLAALWLTTNEPSGTLVFRCVFFVASLGAALGAVEVYRGAFHGSRFGVPVIVSSAAMVLLALVGLIGSFAGITPASSIMFVRGVLVGSTFYVICATVSLLFLANRRPGASDILEAMDIMAPVPLLRALVRERLVRARTRDEQHWSFVDLRLDDATDLREATGDLAYASMVARFEDVVVRWFPSDADLGRVSPGHVYVFVSQPSASVRATLRGVLTDVARSEDTGAAFRLSASAGICTVDPAVDTFDSLIAASSAAADEAQLEGGDRWRRAEAVVTERARP